MTDFIEEIVAEATRKTAEPDPDTEPDPEQIVNDAIGKPRGVKRRTGEHTYVTEETS